MKRMRFVIIGLVLLAALLRFPFLDEQGIAFDEAYGMVVCRMGWDTVLAAALASGVHPPLFYVAHKVELFLWGVTEFGMRFGAAASSVLAIPLIYRLGRRLFGGRAGMLAALLLAVHPIHIWFSQHARMYSYFFTLGMACMLAFWWAVRSNRKPAWAALVLLHAAAFYMHYFSLLLPTVQFLFLVITFRRNYRLLRVWTLAQVLAGLPLVPWIIATALRETKSFGIAFLLRPDPADLFLTLWNFTTGIIHLFWPLPLFGLAIALAVLLYGLLPSKERAGAQIEAQIITALWAFLPLLVVWAASQKRSFYSDRYLLFAMPAFVMLIAFGVSRLPSTRLSALAAASLVGMSALGFAAIHTDPAYHKDGWREAAAYVAGAEEPGDVALAYHMGMRFPFSYYFDGDAPVRDLSFNQVWYPVEELTAGHERAWLLYSYVRDPTHFPLQPLKPSGYWREDPERNPAVADWFDAGYRNATYRHFLGVEVWAVDLGGM